MKAAGRHTRRAANGKRGVQTAGVRQQRGRQEVGAARKSFRRPTILEGRRQRNLRCVASPREDLYHSFASLEPDLGDTYASMTQKGGPYHFALQVRDIIFECCLEQRPAGRKLVRSELGCNVFPDALVFYFQGDFF